MLFGVIQRRTFGLQERGLSGNIPASAGSFNHGNCHGNGPDRTEADGMRVLIDWVEHNKAPEAIRVAQTDQKTGEAICENTV